MGDDGAVRTAFVMGAGLGKRLRPLTDSRPKPLVPIFGQPLVAFVFDHLRAVGVERLVVNTHHRAERWAEFFPEKCHDGVEIQLVHEPDLLETGGGIANARPYLGDDAFLVYSGDVVTDVDLGALVAGHFRSGNAVTLGLRDTGIARGIAFEDGRVTDIGGRYGRPGTYDFANVSVWSAEAADWLPVAAERAPFAPVLAERIGRGGRIGGVELADGEWFNVGNRAEYLRVHGWIAANQWRPAYGAAPGWPQRVHPTAKVEAGAALEGFSAVGAGSVIRAGAILRDTVVWDNAVVEAGARLDGCVVRDFQVASGDRSGEDI